MFTRSLLVCCTVFLLTLVASADSVVRKWKTVDEKTGATRSIIELTQKEGVVTGKILKIFPGPGEDADPVCDKCPPSDPRYMKKVIGMEIIRGLKAEGDTYAGGEILDPEDGKTYRLKVWVEKGNLKVRGYVGPLYRTQTWLPAE